MITYAPERPQILAELAERPGQTAYEVAWHLGFAKPDSHRVARLVTRMLKTGDLIYKTEFRPLQGRDVKIFYVAPQGTPRPPSTETPQQAVRRRERNRLQKARTRAAAATHGGRPRIVTEAELGPAGRVAACRRADPDLFFGPDRESADQRARRVAAARVVCAGCPVRARCLEVAEANGEAFGVWGGVDFETIRQLADLRAADRTTEAEPVQAELKLGA